MVKIIFKCEKCGCQKGIVYPYDRTVEVECENCHTIETAPDKTSTV